LFRNEVGDDGALAFSVSTNFPKLETLYLGDNNITDKGAVVLIESKAFPALKTLDLGKNLLGEASAMAALKVNRAEKILVIYR
jgi:Leucine-rich repeat (LRR) protein